MAPPLQTRSNLERRKQGARVILIVLVAAVAIGLLATREVGPGARTKAHDSLQAKSFAEVAVNLVVARIREATTQKSNADEFAPWSSQPGAIRVFQPYGELKAIYRLYSSARMVADSLPQLEQDDLQKDWDREPDQWVDLNAPIVNKKTEGKSGAPEAVVFPIADPRSSRAEMKDSVEGFDYREAVNGVVRPSGAGANSQRLPMPVRWLYLLADGTIGVLGKAGRFVSSTGGGEPSMENPIVGRMAFWTDDETCRINLNTASEGVFWDTPRASTEEDKWLGQSQPVNGEWQRYPGHPAMVCLSSVLFPHKRFRALHSESAPPAGGTIAMEEMSVDEVKAIWRASPYVYGKDDDRTSFGGRKKPADLAVSVSDKPSQLKTIIGESNTTHLYNSYDEYPSVGNADTKADVSVNERTPDSDKVLKLPADRLEQGRFFLTTRSSAPEISLSGLPRVALWPMNSTVISELASSRKAGSLSRGSRYSVLDAQIAFNSSTRKGTTVFPYFFQRQDVMSPHQEFYNNSAGRNKVLWDYLTKAFISNMPGFGLRRADPTGTNFRNFADKYGPTRHDNLPAITAGMIDYIRTQNLLDGNLLEGNRYLSTPDYGQVTPLCLCGGLGEHSATWFIASRPLPKGIGRFVTVTEVALVVGLRARQAGGATTPEPAGVLFHPDNRKLVGNAAAAGTDFYEVEAGLLIELFAPAQGWGEYRPECSFTLGGLSGGAKLSTLEQNTQTATTDQSIGKMGLCGKQLLFDGSADSSMARTVAGPPPKDWIGWGGTLGVRSLGNMITFKPILFPVQAGQRLPPFSFSGTVGSENHLRLLVYNVTEAPDASAGVDTGNLIQFIPLAFPQNDGGYPLPTNNPHPFRRYPGDDASVTERMQETRASGMLFGPDGLVHPGDVVQSLVPNHGDFRLLAAKRAVMQGRGSGVANLHANECPTFVAHPNYGLRGYPLAHSLSEPKPEMNLALPRRPVPGVLRDFGYFTNDATEVGLNLRPEYMPDFPIKPWANYVNVRFIGGFSAASLAEGALSGGREMSLPMRDVFNMTRYDWLGGSGASARFRRGAARPDITGDFDTGMGPCIDGPYINHGDAGEVRGPAPYFSELDATTVIPKLNSAFFSPNRVIPSAGVFGSLPTGVAENVPWQTLLFRPDPELAQTPPDPERRHFGSRYPRDHLFMDMFWMPVVEPYAISEPFETKGKINMNYQILPFTYITRATALHALFKSEKVMAIPDSRTRDYKIGEKEGGDLTSYRMADVHGRAVFRHFIDAEQTLKQFEERFAGIDEASTSRGIKPGAFLSATEICDQWLVPQGQTREGMGKFWQTHRQTGDNLKERPYATLYPRLTTRSNAYRVHVVSQSLRKGPNSDPGSFRPEKGDQVTAEYRGAYVIERSIDPTDSHIPDYASKVAQLEDYEPLDAFYSYRITEVKE